jgi:hypothetical protein
VESGGCSIPTNLKVDRDGTEKENRRRLTREHMGIFWTQRDLEGRVRLDSSHDGENLNRHRKIEWSENMPGERGNEQQLALWPAWQPSLSHSFAAPQLSKSRDMKYNYSI